MASYNFIDNTIRIYKTPFSQSVSIAHLAEIQAHPDVMVSFTHEFLHSIQAASSLYGIRLLTEFMCLSVFVVAVASGRVHASDNTASWEPFSLVEAVDALQTKQLDEVISVIPEQVERAVSLSDEISALFREQQLYYSLSKNVDWHLEQQVIGKNKYQEKFWGVATPDGYFWAFTPGMLAENMARRIDRKLAFDLASPHLDYEDTSEERGYYNGLYNLLKARECIGALGVIPSNIGIEELTVLLAQLALMSRRPDHAIVAMLETITQLNVSTTPETLVKRLITDLRVSLFDDMPLWGLEAYKDTVQYLFSTGVLNGIVEGNIVRNHLVQIAHSVTHLRQKPLTFVMSKVSWRVVVCWMEHFGLPLVKASDGPVEELCGVVAKNEYSAVGQALGIFHHRIKSYRG